MGPKERETGSSNAHQASGFIKLSQWNAFIAGQMIASRSALDPFSGAFSLSAKSRPGPPSRSQRSGGPDSGGLRSGDDGELTD
jgi:hypothetical protein